MLKEKDKKDKIEEYISKIVTPIFDEVLKGTKTNTMGVDVWGGSVKFAWRPNNYRIQLPFNRRLFNRTPTKNLSFPMEHKISNYGSKDIFRIERGLTLVIDKQTATITYSLKDRYGKKQWYLVESENLDNCIKGIKEIKENIKNKLIGKLKEIIRVYGGWADYDNIIWARYEDDTRNEETIDKLPKELIIYRENFKKVYQESMIEVTGYKGEEPTEKLCNYIENQLIERQSPKIIQKLTEIGQNQTILINKIEIMDKEKISNLLSNFNIYNQSLNELNKNTLLEIKNKKLHQKVLESMDKTLKQIRGEYSRQRKLKEGYQTRLGSWI